MPNITTKGPFLEYDRAEKFSCFNILYLLRSLGNKFPPNPLRRRGQEASILNSVWLIGTLPLLPPFQGVYPRCKTFPSSGIPIGLYNRLNQTILW